MELNENAIYKVAITMFPGVGDANVRRILSIVKDEKLFFENLNNIEEVQDIIKKQYTKDEINLILDKAKRQLDIAIKNNIDITFYTENKYPRKLANAKDAPLIIYTKGKANFDSSRTVAIIGTRTTDSEGRENIYNLVEGLKEKGINVIIISGLALGADSFAHQAALKYQLPTAGVLGHGFDMLYPAENRHLANEIANGGGILITPYYYGHPVSRTTFPRRNKIVAALSDAVIVAQCKIEGGSLITVEYAINYHKDIFAYPGRATDKLYTGCNNLIRDNKATLITNHIDLMNFMKWKPEKKGFSIQKTLDLTCFTPQEIKIIDYIRQTGIVNIDEISVATQIPMAELSPILLSLEFKDILRSLPGKRYEAK
ncbi:MAG: DNA-processing protein DprA [Bacteroidales bacterium]|nr:DNA-processing protein DprA [Bacteroidales bacterium]